MHDLHKKPMAYSLIEGIFYYEDQDGDSFQFAGYIDEFFGGGNFIVNETIRPGDPKGWDFDFLAAPQSYIVITEASNFTDELDDSSIDSYTLSAISYYDSESDQRIDVTPGPFDFAFDFSDLGGDVILAEETYSFDTGRSVDLPLNSTTPEPTPEPEPEPTPEPEPEPTPEPEPEDYEPPTTTNEINGTKRDDELKGTRSADLINGKKGDDTLEGNKGGDILKGGSGVDILTGSRGQDYLDGQKGADILKGGKGADVFQISKGIDIIEDFSISQGDKVALHKKGGYTIVESDDGGGVLILVSTKKQLFLQDVQYADIAEVDMDIFVQPI